MELSDYIILAQGNPGAIAFLSSVVNNKQTEIIERLKQSTIRGTDLYILWSDLCDKNLEKVAVLCEKCPIDILEDACSRQDYSGKKLVEQYI